MSTNGNGVIVFWSFWQRKRPDVKGWHLTADAAGAEALKHYLVGLADGEGKFKRLALEENTDAVKVAGNAHKAVFGKLLNLRYDSVNPETFSITDASGEITLTFGEVWRLKLLEGVVDILNDRAGAPLEGEASALSFWWFRG